MGSLSKMDIFERRGQVAESINKTIYSSEDTPFNFWKKYDDDDYLERKYRLKKIVDHMSKIYAVKDKGVREFVLTSSLQSYFDDILEYCRRRKR